MKDNCLLLLYYYTCALLLLTQYCLASCPSNCNGHGDCNKFSRCQCFDGYQGGDCSERICPFSAAWSDFPIATDLAHQPAECSNRGICDRKTGDCMCMDGFSGAACERLTCSEQCQHKGVCYSMHDLAGKTRNDYSKRYDYTAVWDAFKIQGCACDYPNFGYDCSLRDCAPGDDPLTGGQVNEIQLVQCKATTGSFVLFYNGIASRWIPSTANANVVRTALLAIPQLKDVKVTFSLPHGTACQLQTNLISIEFTQNFGPQYPLVPQGDPTLISSGGSILVNADGVTSWSDFDNHLLRSRKGTKENDICANRGVCDEIEGTCTCFDTNGDAYASSNGYGIAGTRGDCGYVLSSTLETGISSCPGVPQCSGHGVCDPVTFRCYCSKGFSGGDCSERVCPSAKSWFSYPTADNVAHFDLATCSNMGLCDKTTGKCQCRPGFYGEACEYMSCGGGVENPCSGHGTCMSMSQLALWAKNNGDDTDYTYGSDPNNPFTWDYDKVQGCLCDEGWSGYDCSLKDCVRGDDPGTYEDHVEVQLLQCIASSGNFSLSFRGEHTGMVPYNLNAAELQALLQGLTTIKRLNVYFAFDGPPPKGTLDYVKPVPLIVQGAPVWYNPINATRRFSYNASTGLTQYLQNSSFCDPDGQQIAIIEFTHTHGDLPAIQVDNEFLVDSVHSTGLYGSGRIKVYTDGLEVYGLKSIKGTTENDFCNNRGLCNRVTGQCECFPTWTSSNGARQGGPGYTGDCGYRNDFLYSSFSSLEAPFTDTPPFTAPR